MWKITFTLLFFHTHPPCLCALFFHKTWNKTLHSFVFLSLPFPTTCLHGGLTACLQHLHFRPKFCQMTVSFSCFVAWEWFCSVGLCFSTKYYPTGRDDRVDLQDVHVNTHPSLFKHWHSSILAESGVSVALNPVTAIRQEMSAKEKNLPEKCSG